MAERFNVRNVAQKEIYDSYMGILRISPNDGIDDPTELLLDVNGKGVILSDSNGTMLPISFSPKAFMRKVYDGSEKPIINITTTAQNTTYVSNTLTVRSTLLLKKNAGIQDKTSALVIGSSSSNDSKYSTSPKSILHYPIEAPNDKKYFNDGNEYQLFKEETHPLTHYEQVKQALNKKDQDWYTTNSLSNHQVKVNGEYIFTHNDDGDQIPILHSRDYVLGSYDGHSWKNTSDSDSKAVKFNDNISDANSPFNAINSFNDVTKMSWLRIDDIIWQALEQVLAGDTRHFNGRYTNLGNATSKIEDGAAQDVENNQTSIIDKLFDTKNTEINEKQQIRKYAPILGQGVQNGLIMYHAMPFHRYWFHRCRQAKANIIRKYKGNSPIDDTTQEYVLYKSSNDVITKSSMASVTPVHSLVKNFLLCNGNVVNFKNFPNINPSNANLFDISDEDFGKPTETFTDIDFGDETKKSINDTKKSIHEAMFHSKITDAFGGNTNPNHIVLPNLFSLKDKSPRFIRGMDFINHDEKTKFTFDLQKIHRLYYYSKDFFDLDKGMLKAPLKDDFGNFGNAYEKFYSKGTTPKDAVELHFYNYDFLTPTTTHTHQLFSNHQGGIGLTNDYTKCYYYDTNQNDGGNLHKRWALKNTINRNLLFNNVGYPSTKWLSPTQKVEIGSNRDTLFALKNPGAVQKSNSKTKKVKGWDEVGWVLQQSKLWLDYCLGQHTKQLFKNFTPIPNVGLFLFNGDLFNQKSRQYNLQYNVPKDQSYQLIYTWQTKPFTDSTNSTDSKNKTLIPQMTISNVTDAKLENKNLTGYSSSIVAANINSGVVKKIKQEWKAKNKIYSAVKACFTKKIKGITYYAMNINDSYEKITEVHCDYNGKKYIFSIDGNGLKTWEIDETKYKKIEPETETEYYYRNEDDYSITIRKGQKDYDIFDKLEACQLNFTSNLEQTYKFKTNKLYVSESKELYEKVTDADDDTKKNRRIQAWNTYIYFMQNPLPTKTLSTSTLKKKASLAEIETYVNSYDTQLLSFSGSAAALYGSDRGTISVLQEGDNPWQGYCYYDAQGGKHLIQKLGGYTLTESDKYGSDNSNQEGNEKENTLDTEIKNKLTLHNEQKMKRRMLAMKINESQACIPISYYGKAQFSTRYLYTYERKRSSGSSAGKGDEWDTEQQNFTIKDVGNYIIGMYDNSNNHQGEGVYRCVTSLAYTNPEYLGFGDITQPYDPQKPQTYWNVNNVTDFYKSQNSKTSDQLYRTTYGDSQFIDVDTKSPYPTHIKLLPLIRL